MEPNVTVVRPAPVVPSVARGSLIEVDGDLRAGQMVVTLGKERLRPGDAVLPSSLPKEGKQDAEE